MPLSPNSVWRLGSAYGLAATGLGAFGAHGLQARRPDLPARQLKSWETASAYLLAHALALLALSGHARLRRSWAPGLLAAGAALFSGSLYGLVLAPDAWKRVLGPVTPIGGTLMLAGWAVMMF